MSVNMLLFMLENCLVDLKIDYSSVWPLLPEKMHLQYSNVFEALRVLRRSIPRKKYNLLVKEVTNHVSSLEDAAVKSSRLVFDPTSILPEVRKRNVTVAVLSLLGEKALRRALELHGLEKHFDTYVARARVDQPPGFMFPLRMARLLVKDRPGSILFFCADSDTIRRVREAAVSGVRIVALPAKPSEVRNIVMAKPDIFLSNIYEVVDLIDLGLA
jgi:beta-phosphoglucomutase-like phosphatase (HAD superfamily)